MKSIQIGFFAILLVFSGCQKFSSLDLGTFDQATFQSDRGGCQGKRKALLDSFKILETKLLGASENQIKDALGRYDFQILDERSQKIFVYYFEPGAHCEVIQNPSEAMSVALYFNAIGLVKQVTFQRGMP